jgi:hypothetical protein
MTNMPRPFRLALAGAALLTTACGSDSPSGPNTPGTASFDVAAVLAEIGRGTPTAARAEMGASALAGALPVVPSACSYVAASQSFTCPAQTVNGVTITLSYTLLDAAGHPQSSPNVATTAAVRTLSTIKGTLTIPAGGANAVSGTVTLDRTEDMTLSGLLTGVHTLNGTASGTSVSVTTFNGQSIEFTSVDKSTTTNVVLPKATSTTFWPVSGTITSDQTLTSTSGSLSGLKTTIHMVMTFDGSANIVVKITIDGVSSTCTINMQNPGTTTCSA